MPTNVESTIWTALADHLNTLVTTPALPIAWPNVSFTPPSDGPFLRVTYLVNSAETPVIPYDGHIRHSGILQVSVMWPEGEGITAPLQIADTVREHFPRGWNVRLNGVLVQVNRAAGINATLQDPPYSLTPVSIPFESFVRPT